ncbi:MAG: PaaI family thioesterase [Proteobacteria bacterium]|nr:PaaI family thioesterase [Pseudomonadota bacterium]
MDTLLLSYLQDSPYASNYKMQLLKVEPDVECVTPWQDEFVGNPLIQAWHGGIITGILELTGKLQALKVAAAETGPLLSANINFLRPTRGNSIVHTRARLIRSGKQIINIDAVAWQVSPEEPTTTASLTFAKKT